MNPQRVVENCMAEIFDDMSIHPSGVITAWASGKAGRYQVRVTPKRTEGVVTDWKYAFTDPKGNVSVGANTVSHAAIMIGRIQRWRWTL